MTVRTQLEYAPGPGSWVPEFLKTHIISAGAVLPVKHSYYPSPLPLTIVPDDPNLPRRSDEGAEGGPVFVAKPESSYWIVALQKGRTFVYDVFCTSMESGRKPILTGAGFEVLPAGPYDEPQVRKMGSFDTGEGMLQLPLDRMDWVKVIDRDAEPTSYEEVDTDRWTHEQVAELELPGDLIAAVDKYGKAF